MEYFLSTDHSREAELAVIFPDYEVTIQVEQLVSVLLQQQFTPQDEKEFLQLKNSAQYVFFRHNNRLEYDTDRERLGIVQPTGEIQHYDLSHLTFIDTQQMPQLLQDILQDHSHLEYNFRPHYLTLSPTDSARLLQEEHQLPLLEVRRTRKRTPERYFFNHIASILNVSKPRLSPFFNQYGIETINTSTKGILARPAPAIREALELEGVRVVMGNIHLLGLLISIIRASGQLIGMIHHYGFPQFGEQLRHRVRKLLIRSPGRLFNYYYPSTSNNLTQFSKRKQDGNVKHLSRLEGLYFRPFVETLREVVSMFDVRNPLLFIKNGRNVSRRIRKRSKEGVDFLGGYTPFDAALNTMNRHLRYRLRLLNAKLGFGFHTDPLFSHRYADKPGRAGHLDLEEVGRIVSRFVLLQEILRRRIQKKDFQPRLDEDYFIYYVPWHLQLKVLRQKLVRQQAYNTPIFYNDQWLPNLEPHRQHVAHLRWCLEQSVKINAPIPRLNFLLASYNPLIFQVKPFNHIAQDAEDEFFFLFKYCWVERTTKLWQRLGIASTSYTQLLFNSDLVTRLLGI